MTPQQPPSIGFDKLISSRDRLRVYLCICFVSIIGGNMSHLNFGILAFSTNFCPIKTDLSGNTV